MKVISNARPYQPFAFGRSRPGKILSKIMNMMVATTTSKLGSVIVGIAIYPHYGVERYHNG
jgi:hypothetical protein